MRLILVGLAVSLLALAFQSAPAHADDVTVTVTSCGANCVEINFTVANDQQGPAVQQFVATFHGLTHKSAAIRTMGTGAALWYSAERGLFSDKPHLALDEHSWDPDTKTATIRYFIVDAATGDVSSYAQTFQAYSDSEYRSLLADWGFRNVEFFPSLTGDTGGSQRGLIGMVATK